MPHTRYDDIDHLKAELEQERHYRDTIEWSNTELERSIAELTAYLDELDTNSRAADDNEWKVRFDSQTAMNKQLQDQKDFLETELTEARRRLTTGSYPEAMNFNLDALNEPELLRLVKHLERMRNDLFSTLRDSEWKLDKESKEFHHFDEMRRAYKADLKHANATIEKMRLGHVLDPSGAVSPIYPPGYFSWLDTQPGQSSYLDSPMQMKKGTKKGGKGAKGERPDESPTRSKSRADKKTKKKDGPPAEESSSSSPPAARHIPPVYVQRRLQQRRKEMERDVFPELSDPTTDATSIVRGWKTSNQEERDNFNVSVLKERRTSTVRPVTHEYL